MEIPHEGHAVNPKRGLGEQIMQRPTKQQHLSHQRELCVSVSLLGMGIPDTLLHETGKKQPQWQNSVPFFFLNKDKYFFAHAEEISGRTHTIRHLRVFNSEDKKGNLLFILNSLTDTLFFHEHILFYNN